MEENDTKRVNCTTPPFCSEESLKTTTQVEVNEKNQRFDMEIDKSATCSDDDHFEFESIIQTEEDHDVKPVNGNLLSSPTSIVPLVPSKHESDKTTENVGTAHVNHAANVHTKKQFDSTGFPEQETKLNHVEPC